MSTESINVAVVGGDGVRRGLSRLLPAAGFRPIGNASAEDFLGAEVRAKKTGCIVLDLHLRAMSEVNLHQPLVALGETLSVVFIAAQEQSDEPDRSKHPTFAELFQKPVRAKPLLAAIRCALAPPGTSDG